MFRSITLYEDESKTLLRLIVDTEGKLVGLLGDENDEGCPVAFAPSADLISALRLFLLEKSRELDDIIGDRGIYQLVLEEMDTAYEKLIEMLEEKP